MATDSVNITEDPEMAECDGDKVVTMMDVLQEQQEFEEDANAVLGASDDKNCTYAQGYIKRQALYACLTCCPDAKTDISKRAGVCLACSLHCHENHELVELYTKRNFRCDCGNPNFSSHPCQFTPNKQDLNDDNIYNHNFSGLYCICKRPYPDPESTVEDDMIQCIVCEDWLHASHLDAVVPANDQYSEMICKGCMMKNEFLHDYSNFAVNIESTEVDVITVNGDSLSKEDGINKAALANNTDEKTGNEENKDDKVINSEDNDEKKESTQSSEQEILNDKKDDENKETKENEPSNNTEQNSGVDGKDTAPEIQEQISEIPVSDLNDNKTENSEQEEIPADSSAVDTKNTSECEQDKPQVDDNRINNPDEKTDAVMDAIDELLKEPAENNEDKETTGNLDNKENVDASQNDVEMSEINNKVENENGSNEKLDTGTEIPSEDKSHSETEALNEVTEKAVGIETTESTKEIKSSADDAADSNLGSDINETSTDKVNGDINDKTETKEINNSNENKVTETNENKRKHSIEAEESSPKKAKLNKNCVRPRNVKRVYKGATFWASNFRQKLCTCNDCISMYKDLDVLFLTDFEDTVSAYESLGKEKIDGGVSQYEKGLQALSSLDRIQQINALTEYNRMRDKLLDFLKSFKDRKEVVKEEDIKAFFAGMKPRREPDGVYFCR